MATNQDHYITPDELRQLADACDALDPLWNLMVGNDGPLTIEMDEAPVLLCYSGTD